VTDANREVVRRAAWLRQQAQELDFQGAVQRAVVRAVLAPRQARLLAVRDQQVRWPAAA